MLTKFLKVVTVIVVALLLLLLPILLPSETLEAAENRALVAPASLSGIRKSVVNKQTRMRQSFRDISVSTLSQAHLEKIETKPEPEPRVSQPTTPTASPVAATSHQSVTMTEAEAKEEIARRESGGSYTAQNGQYYGRYQLTITYLNGDLSPENQERVADTYVATRYGSWVAALAFWNTNGWY